MHSPLLKESQWVSHPPPTYMLKFSGLADLSSCFGKQTGKSPVHTGCLAVTQLQRSYTQAQRPACNKQGTMHYLCHGPQHALTHNDTPQQNFKNAAAAFCLCVWIHRHWNRQTFRSSLKAQCTFKSLLIHGILLFSMFITLCCTLHHHPSQGIQCWKLCGLLRTVTTSFEHLAAATTRDAQGCCHEPRRDTKLVQSITFVFVNCRQSHVCWHGRGPM